MQIKTAIKTKNGHLLVNQVMVLGSSSNLSFSEQEIAEAISKHLEQRHTLKYQEYKKADIVIGITHSVDSFETILKDSNKYHKGYGIICDSPDIADKIINQMIANGYIFRKIDTSTKSSDKNDIIIFMYVA